MGACYSALLARWDRWRHPIECSIASSHSVYNPLLGSAGDDDVWLEDDSRGSGGGISGSLVLAETPSPPAAHSYSDFLMRESVIDQRLQGVADVLGPPGIFAGAGSSEETPLLPPLDGRPLRLDRLDHHPSGARAPFELPEAPEEAEPADPAGGSVVDATCYRSAVGPGDGAA